MISCSLALLCGACETSKSVGSACRDGVCPEALATAAPVCSVSETNAQIAVTNRPGEPAVLGSVCLPRPLARDESGKVGCRVLWQLPETPNAEAPAACSERPFLAPGPDANTCLLAQISAPSGGAANGDGWYYDDSENRACASGGPSIQFTDAAKPPSGVQLSIRCWVLQGVAADGGLVARDSAQCTLPSDSARHASSVGDACSFETVPVTGFDDREVYLETGSPECATGACLVYHLRGDPAADCKPSPAATAQCAGKDEVKNRVYCSCRCDAPPGDPGGLCACPHGFSCVHTFDSLPAGLRGSYCVRNNTYTTP
jgi:hypothetical protein